MFSHVQLSTAVDLTNEWNLMPTTTTPRAPHGGSGGGFTPAWVCTRRYRALFSELFGRSLYSHTSRAPRRCPDKLLMSK